MYKFYNMTATPSDDGGTLTIEIDLTQPGRESGSGKTITRATCGKPKEIILPDGSAVMLGCTVFQYPDRK